MSGGKFSFGKLFLGFGTGVMIPHVVNNSTFYAIYISFLLPHKKFWQQKAALHRDKAIPVESLDAYLTDVGKSFLFFLFIIGPTLYSSYYLKHDMLEQYGMGENPGKGGGPGDSNLNKKESYEMVDTYALILKRMKGIKAEENDQPKNSEGL